MSTIIDVAERAGVSVATVSRMMNNPDVVSEKTKEKVHKAMEDLKYQPNEMARALQQKKSNIIGMVLPIIDYAFFSRLTDAVEETCHSFGYKLMLCKSGKNEEREQEMLSLLQANKADGIIICSRYGDATDISKYEFPVVSVEREIEGVPSIVVDDYMGGALAARELLRAGSRKPLVFGTNVPDYFPGTKRIQGFKEECAKQGVKVKECLLSDHNLLGKKPLELAFDDYMNANSDVDGLFSMGDLTTAQILLSEGAHNMDLLQKIPIVSFDGFDVSEWMGISSVAQPIREMGECAVEMLVKQIEGKIVPEKSILPVTLLQRKSTAKFLV